MRLLITLLFVILHGTCVRAQETTLDSRIDHVTVYRRGAEIRRTAALDVPAGRHDLVFTGLPEALVESSVRLQTNHPDLLVLSVRHRPYLPPAPGESVRSRALGDSLALLDRRQRRLQARLAIGQEEEAVLQANRDLGGAAGALTAETLQQGVAYHRERLTAIRLERLTLTDSLQLLDERRREIAAARSTTLSDTTAKAGSEVVVEVEAAGPLRDSVMLRYTVADAGWDPVYDVRMVDLQRPLDFSYRATVRQVTGEDWREVRLTLSTGNPGRSVRTPELVTWRLAPGLRPPVYDLSDPGILVTRLPEVSGSVVDDDGQPLIGATVEVVGFAQGTVTDIDGAFELKLPEQAEKLRISYMGYQDEVVPITGAKLHVQLKEVEQMLDDVVVVGYAMEGALAGRANGVQIRDRTPPPPPSLPLTVERRPTTLNYAIALPYTIPSGGAERSVEIRRFTIPATYRYTAVPKVDERVFLSAVVRDWEQYDLLDGEMQLFVGNAYLGAYPFRAQTKADSLTLSLGPDPGIVVSREPTERYARDGGLSGGKRNVTRGWMLSARNTKEVAVDLLVYDQVPVSSDGDVDVRADVPDGAAFDPETGQLRWHTVLQPQGAWEAGFSYRVRYGSGTVYLE